MNRLQQVNDQKLQARQLRGRAAECRSLADIADSDRDKASYLELADAYEKLAEQEAILRTHARIEEIVSEREAGQ